MPGSKSWSNSGQREHVFAHIRISKRESDQKIWADAVRLPFSFLLGNRVVLEGGDSHNTIHYIGSMDKARKLA